MDREIEKQLDTRAHDLDDTEEISTTDGTPRREASSSPSDDSAMPKFGSAGAEREAGSKRD